VRPAQFNQRNVLSLTLDRPSSARQTNLLATFGGSSSGGLVSAPSASASTSVPDRLQALKQSKLGVGFRPKPIELELDDELPESDEADADVAQAVRGRERSSDALFSSPPPALPALVTSSPASSSRSPQPGPSLSRATPPVALPDRSIESDSPDPVEAYDPDQDSQSIRPSSPQHRPAAQLLSPVAQGKQRERSVTLAVLKVDMQSLMRGRRGTPTGRQASVAPLDQDEGEDEIADDLPSVLGSAAVGKRPMSVARDTPSDGEEEGEATPLVLHRPPPAAPVQPRSQAASPGSIAPRPRRTRTVRFNSAEVISRHRSARSRPDHPLTSGAIAGDGSDVISGDRASITAPAEIAERELSRTIVKADFATMEPLGQFNMGFIIARKRTAATADRTGGDDLFIIDQHASDEKFNFETLQNETRILSQGLIQCVLRTEDVLVESSADISTLTDPACSSSRPSTSSSSRTTWMSSRRTASRSASKKRPAPRTTRPVGRLSPSAPSRSARRPSLTFPVRRPCFATNDTRPPFDVMFARHDRSRGAAAPDEGPAVGPDGSLLESAGDVCDACVPQERHGRSTVDQASDD
jgi:hypothetical protein